MAGHFVPVFYFFAQLLFLLGIAAVLSEILILFNPKIKIEGTRTLPKMLSNGDINLIRLDFVNHTNLKLHLKIIDELPVQLQVRNFEKSLTLAPLETAQISYEIRPTERGNYHFGNINIFVSTVLKIVERKIIAGQKVEAPVYPSILQVKRFALKAINQHFYQQGVKKIRKIGHSYEFEQIKNYVKGDDFRVINWNASSRKGQLMVNQYEDEISQQVYSIIDKSRTMKMPFHGLSLLDYAINTSLVISNLALRKHDLAGLITFSDKLGAIIKAERNNQQLNKMLQALFKEKERTTESNYELLYFAVRKLIQRRSLILLFTNFESEYALDRALPVLRKINKFHLLVVIFFENTEISALIEKGSTSTEDIYHQTVAQKFLNEKHQLIQKLQHFGIQSILTIPENLSINTINKYLELKARGLI